MDDLLLQYPFFDTVQLKNELCVVYSDPQMFSDCKTPVELLSYMFNNALHNCMPELYKLISIVVTIPVSSASVERSFSALKRIKSFARNSMHQNRLTNVALISIEKELLKSMCESDTFYDNIIDYFGEHQEQTNSFDI